MAKVAGLFSVPHGKLAQLVFATWKGIGYARLYVIPGNPQTVAQTTVRTKFRKAVWFSKAILSIVLQPYVDPFVKQVSAFAKCVGDFMDDSGDPTDYTALTITSGNLEGTLITGATYAGSAVTLTWSATCQGNGQATDKACCVIYDHTNHVAFINSAAARSAATANVTVGSGRNAGELHAFLFFTDSTSAPTTVSNSSAEAVS